MYTLDDYNSDLLYKQNITAEHFYLYSILYKGNLLGLELITHGQSRTCNIKDFLIGSLKNPQIQVCIKYYIGFVVYLTASARERDKFVALNMICIQ